ncbi:hypothetical protein VTJ49DRAFT_3884 [Mycothermus thermophilus]|uniref:Phospholipid metabolism enzyme regulator n=1 Tax=Humicola insolens TaxID=85995 RepID=A0ABR3VR81_HUMIN
MDRSPSMSADASDPLALHATYSRESSASTVTITPTAAESATSKFTSQASASSTSSSANASREPSPTRPTARKTISRTSSANSGLRSRQSSYQDLSPARTGRSTIPRSLSSGRTPTLLPSATDPNPNVGPPVKSPTTMEHLRESPRWPVSPRLRSPPPMLNRPNIGLPRRPEQQQQPETPLINVQRPTPPIPATPDVPSETDGEDTPVTMAPKNPLRPGATPGPTLETVQEVSPIGSPHGRVGCGDESVDERLQDSVDLSEVSQTDSLGLGFPRDSSGRSSANDSGSETDNTRVRRQSGAVSAPPLTTRHSSTFVKQGVGKSKTGEPSLQSMTVETETVTSIPQATLVPGASVQGSTTSLRTQASTETIRPKKEKRKPSRKQPTVTAGNGEPTPTSPGFPALLPRLRRYQSMGSVVPSSYDSYKAASPTKPHQHHQHHHHHFYFPDEAAVADSRPRGSSARRQSMTVYNMSNLLTRSRTASSKADIFEAKVASAVEEAQSSDSEETFVYDSNPPDGRDRPMRFRHSRTPSTTSMASQLDRAGLRSIHSVLESALPPVPVKKNMKFVNTSTTNANSESPFLDDDGRGTGRGPAGSARGPSRHQHHHFGRWGRGGTGNSGNGNGHPSLFAEHSPFGGTLAQGNVGSRQGSQPPSPRYLHGPRFGGKRGTHLSAGYDLDDTTTGADDERTPLISGTIRSSRSGRNRRGMPSLRSLEAQAYRSSAPSVLNRFASCLVLTVMILLVVSGAIGFMFATSQPLTDIQLVAMDHVVASQQELMLDLTIKAHNPNVVVVVVDSADIEVFAKSPHAGSDSDWWYHSHPGEMGPPPPRKIDGQQHQDQQRSLRTADANPDPDPSAPDDSAPNMRLGTITGFESALSFEGSFFHKGISYSSGEVRLKNPGNGTYGGQERWERIMEDEFTLILKGVLKYTLPLSQRVRTATISGKTLVKPNAANDPPASPGDLPGVKPNGTVEVVDAGKGRVVEEEEGV